MLAFPTLLGGKRLQSSYFRLQATGWKVLAAESLQLSLCMGNSLSWKEPSRSSLYPFPRGNPHSMSGQQGDKSLAPCLNGDNLEGPSQLQVPCRIDWGPSCNQCNFSLCLSCLLPSLRTLPQRALPRIHLLVQQSVSQKTLHVKLWVCVCVFIFKQK